MRQTSSLRCHSYQGLRGTPSAARLYHLVPSKDAIKLQQQLSFLQIAHPVGDRFYQCSFGYLVFFFFLYLVLSYQQTIPIIKSQCGTLLWGTSLSGSLDLQRAWQSSAAQLELHTSPALCAVTFPAASRVS